VTSPLWLIAEREIRTYVATASFWAALAIGPLAAGALLLFGGETHVVPVTIRSNDAYLARAAKVAVLEAADTEGRLITFSDRGEQLVLTRQRPDHAMAFFSAHFPLSDTGRVLVARTIERDVAQRLVSAPRLDMQEVSTGVHRPGVDTTVRFALVCILWLALTGTLGMLLQAIVRERSNRALESLLAGARPLEVVVGKLAGIGAVSLVVLAAWLGSAAVASAWGPTGGLGTAILAKLAAPATLARAALIYVLAYGFYGSATIAIGSRARDVAAAQNLSRPLFIVLVIALFIALACAGGKGPAWLVYVPVLTPFVMLATEPTTISMALQVLQFGILLAASFLVALLAAHQLSISPGQFSIKGAWTRLLVRR
jgi:ABC-type Na+ efflux pump permease subunit